MIYPTARAVLLAALGGPLALVLGVIAPRLWLVGPGWIAFVAAVTFLDAALGADRRRTSLTLDAPATLPSGTKTNAGVTAAFGRGPTPSLVEFAVSVGERLSVAPAVGRAAGLDGQATFDITLHALRRGEGLIEQLSARWRGPFGLVWKQLDQPADRVIPVTLDMPWVRDEALKHFSREPAGGSRSQLEVGGGGEFHNLTDFRPGMNTRSIHWKQSARHGALLAKELHLERNHHIVAAIDTGRLMGEPLAGRPRLDHALNASLLLAYVGLKMGDRVGLFGFDAKPNVASPLLGGVGGFAQVQRLAAAMNYSDQETNYTLGLTVLGGRLSRRSLIVVFTDFADATSAELLLETLGRLLKRHAVLFVVMRDEELEGLERADPQTADDVSRAVIAGRMLRERDGVIAHLRRLGAEIVEGPAGAVGPALLARYLDLKRREAL